MSPTPTQADVLQLFAGELAAAGVEQAVLSPGSRNAPLVLALARCAGIRCTPLIDERMAAFFALGIAKASGRPAVVACTSGTAAAELAPAVHEAREAGTPLIILTADRPPELRAAGENQTIDQRGVFGSAAPTMDAPGFTGAGAQAWPGLAERLVDAAMTPGPVHLNVPLWEPLASEPAAPYDRATPIPWLPLSARSLPIADAELPAGRSVIVAGRDEFGLEDGLAQAADAAGIPVLADPLAPASRSTSSVVIRTWDSLLRIPDWANAHTPDSIIRSGDLPTSKPLREWMARCAAAGTEVLHFDPLDAGRDPLHANSERHVAALSPLLAAGMPGDGEWLAEWLGADARATAALEAELAEHPDSEAALVRSLTGRMSSESVLFTAASMPIRDLESFADLADGPRCLANRGANGIDGTLAAAAGAASASGRPTILLIGDVAFAHDVASLAAVREVETPFVAVVIENGGGAIFDGLPIAARQDVYERFIFTPPRLDVAAACAAWQVEHRAVGSVAEAVALASDLEAQGRPLTATIGIDRLGSAAAREAIRAAVARSVGS